MNLAEQVLAACISVATNQNHGHMTVKVVFNHFINNGITDYTRSQVSKCLSKHPDWWRQGLPKKRRHSCILRELKEEIWQPKQSDEDHIQDLEYELRNTKKKMDVMAGNYKTVTMHLANANDQLKEMRVLWRTLNNLMQDRR